MSTKGIIVLIIVIVVVIAGVAIYNYTQTSEPANQTVTNNSNASLSNTSSSNQNTNSTVTGPSIKVTPSSYDLGRVKYGDVAQKTFTIENSGTEPLEILRVSTSCGCTKASVAEEDKIIAPGKSVSMSVTFDPAVHKDETDLGDLTRIVYLKSNDTINPELEVELQAYVYKED